MATTSATPEATAGPATEMGCAREDREALRRFFQTNGGGSWAHRDGWEEDAIDLDSWYGVTTRQGRVVKLHLEGERDDWRASPALRAPIGVVWKELPLLTGPFYYVHKACDAMSPELGQLGALESLRMISCEMGGSIPKELGGLSALKELTLSCVYMSGAIPQELGQLRALESLRLESNHVTGAIPQELGQLRALESLHLHCNNVTGTIPKELGGLGALKELRLFCVMISGAIPQELGQLRALEILHLHCNNVTGTIPKELGGLGALKELHFYCPQISGAMPLELGQLGALEILCLGDDNLTGIPKVVRGLGALKELTVECSTTPAGAGAFLKGLGGPGALKQLSLRCAIIPALHAGGIGLELGQLRALEILRLSWLPLNGATLKELGGLRGLKVLSIFSVAGIGGVIPPELGQLGALETLELNCSDATGTIPQELGGLSALTTMRIHSYMISGAIPPELGQLGALEVLELMCNNLTGTLPKELGKLGALKKLFLECPKLSGAIPPELGQLGALEVLQLLCGNLTGAIPKELGKLGALKILWLKCQKLCGVVPPELGQLQALETLSLSCRSLTGTLPTELGRLVALKHWTLSCGKISGAIPSQLGQLRALEVLNLSGNNLTGAIPPELGQLSALVVLGLSRNKLTGVIPREVEQLVALKSLSLANNKFTGFSTVEGALRLVTGLGSLRNKPCRSVLDSTFLQGVWIGGNPWVMPPEGVVEKGVPATEKYLLEVRNAKAAGAPAKVLQLIKVVLIGSSRAGKTSVVTSMRRRIGTCTSGEPRDVSTKGIELHRDQINGTTVEYYDCAGQVDYYGMHQTFLTSRALYLLVWDVQKCFGKTGPSLDEVIYEDIMRWLFTLHMRAPGCSVILVANKCDGSLEDFVDTAETVEARARELLKTWQEKRKIPGMTDVTLLRHPSRVSCRDGGGLSQVIDRVGNHGATSVSVPPSWGLALTFLDALRDKRSPLQAARKYLGLDARSEDTHDDASPSVFMTKAALLQRWMGVVQGVEGELRSEADKMAVSDPESALEGALWMSEFAGQIIVVDNGGIIFLDVGWLENALKPILDHTLQDEPVPRHLGKMRDELCHNGQLRLEFARYLWSRVMKIAISDGLFDALCRVVVNLGVAFPLEASSSPADGSGPATPGQSDGSRRDMLVIMRLSESCEPRQERDLEELISEVTHKHEKEVTFKWKFDSAGPPYGLVERVIASCHVVGMVKMGLSWRYGAAFNSHAMATGGGADRLYTFVIRYDVTSCGERRTLSLRMFGPLEDDRVWAALRWVASSVVNLSAEWRGVLWDGWPECARHPLERTYFATPNEARAGGLLLPDAAPGMILRACDCCRIEGTVLRLVLERLGPGIDTRAGYAVERFRKQLYAEGGPTAEEGKSEADLEETSAGSAEMKRGDEHEESERAPEEETNEPSEQRHGDEPPASGRCRRAFNKWRPYAWQTSATLALAAVTLFSVYTGAFDAEGTLWNACLGIVMLWLFGAVVAFSVFVYDFFSAGNADDQRDDPAPDVGIP
ncbi:unnamed protein product [Scytosiphon promiscuus]